MRPGGVHGQQHVCKWAQRSSVRKLSRRPCLNCWHMHEMPRHLIRPALDVACYLLCRRRVACRSSMVHTVLGTGVRRNCPGDLYEVVWLVSIQNVHDPQKKEGGGGLCVCGCEMECAQNSNTVVPMQQGSLLICSMVSAGLYACSIGRKRSSARLKRSQRRRNRRKTSSPTRRISSCFSRSLDLHRKIECLAHEDGAFSHLMELFADCCDVLNCSI